ncbi:MAG: 2Fe-2S iron-sulfur cluster-binding protein, partial [Hyphomicrobiales bacterium]|nr:2Fe-2S iron-sulfur cluster-binding protein [Hyphomicrobiales bacterium]
MPKDENDPYVVFTPSGKRGHIPAGTSLLDAARRLGVDLDSVCGGRGICGRCQIVLAQGEFAKHSITSSEKNLSPFSAVEKRYAEKRTLQPGRRLGCSALIQGDVVIDVPPESQRYRQLVRKQADARDIEVDPLVRLCFVEVEQPDMVKPRSDLERLLDALEQQWGANASYDSALLPSLQKTLRAGKWSATAVLHQVERTTPPRELLCALRPGFHGRALGLAVDVGSTTIAAHLCDLASGNILASEGMMNPQIRFGEDLMSRVSYIMMNPGGDAEMTSAVRDAVNELVVKLCEAAEASHDDIFDIAFAGNPIMHHLLLGIDPVELGGAPFALASGIAMEGFARDINIKLNHGARYYALPCIAGHVGADAAAVILSEAPHLAEEITLIVDVGTNA